ncbi:hypothetical protein MKW98_018621 [Papaver atlanticum]|uniref:Uncharacterized protein n=1 Tax=Papaver atlanticum TaxID=357466 RepID=A0AAD4T5I9_9MAGN|nr:hypothetical protein MKW98_018621 [Papaver atlanticum]
MLFKSSARYLLTLPSIPWREVVAIGEGKTIGKAHVDVSVKTGAQGIYSKYIGTEVDFNGTSHLRLKKDDIVGILETGDVKDLKPLSHRVLIKDCSLALRALITW